MAITPIRAPSVSPSGHAQTLEFYSGDSRSTVPTDAPLDNRSRLIDFISASAHTPRVTGRPHPDATLAIGLNMQPPEVLRTLHRVAAVRTSFVRVQR